MVATGRERTHLSSYSRIVTFEHSANNLGSELMIFTFAFKNFTFILTKNQKSNPNSITTVKNTTVWFLLISLPENLSTNSPAVTEKRPIQLSPTNVDFHDFVRLVYKIREIRDFQFNKYNENQTYLITKKMTSPTFTTTAIHAQLNVEKIKSNQNCIMFTTLFLFISCWAGHTIKYSLSEN